MSGRRVAGVASAASGSTSSRAPRERDGDVVAEGFVCPLCIRELPSFTALQQHAASGDCARQPGAAPKRATSLLGTMRNAVNRRLTRMDAHDDGSGVGTGSGAVDSAAAARIVIDYEPQEIGVVRSHRAGFRERRRARKENNDIQENRLISRLQKLLFSGPAASSTSKARKEYDQSIVPWNDDKLVPACPECGRNFTMRHRRHHCRTCGAVICNSCSLGLDINAAVGMTIPPRLANSKKQVDTAQEVARLREKVTITDDCLRICPFCNGMLTRSLEKKDLSKKAASKPAVVVLYQQMTTAMATIKEKLDPYNELVESMCAHGDITLYDDAAAQRAVIMTCFQDIDKASKRIERLVNPDKAAELPSSVRQNRGIVVVAREFLTKYMVATVALPPQSKVLEIAKQMQAEREEAERREREERERSRRAREETLRARQEAERRRTEEQHSVRRKAEPVSQASFADAAMLRSDEMGKDLSMKEMLEQERQKLVGYLRQAQKTGKKDEVEMLQMQLRQLEVFKSEVRD